MAVDLEAAVPRSMVAGSEAVVLRSIVAAFAPRPCSGRRHALRSFVTSITGRTSTTGITSIAVLRAELLRVPGIITATGTATAA